MPGASIYEWCGTHLSPRNGTLVFLFSLLTAVSLRRFILEHDDPYKCRAIATDGVWYRNHTWLPRGCVSRSSGHNTMRDCMSPKKVVFAGDTSIQPTWWALGRKIDSELARPRSEKSNLHAANDKNQVEYLWDPYLNGSDTLGYIGGFGKKGDESPALMIVGTGHSFAEGKTVEQFADAIDSIASAAVAADKELNAGLESITRKNGPSDLLLFAPVEVPYEESKKSDSPYREMNAHLAQREREGVIDVLWSWDRMTNAREDKFEKNGVDVKGEVLETRADLLLSLRCNAEITSKGGFPNERTCCAAWSGPNWVQATFLIIGLAILPIVVLVDYFAPFVGNDNRAIVRAFSTFTATISLQYVTDRTHLFEQVQRLPLLLHNLLGMILVAAVFGLVSIRRSKPQKKNANGEEPHQPFLSRDQTDELKGWMQLLIIIYHYNRAWDADWFWELIRVSVACYLFLTGFGHTLFFLQKGDYSFKRFAAVMMRTNLLPCTLAYVMRTRWLLYYYMPLSTFWYAVVYFTMAAGSRYNHNRLFLVGKIVLSAWLVDAFISTKDLPETVVRFFTITCNMSFDANEFFHHRVRIDQYIVYVGMLVAMTYLWVKGMLAETTSLSLPGDNKSRASHHFRKLFPYLKWATVGLSLLGMTAFWHYLLTQLHSQQDFTVRQPYLTFIPIIAYLVMRNSHHSLRAYYSLAFAWLGRYSGEMYVMQDHIWLAGDQEAVLRTGLFKGNETLGGDRWRDVLIITPLYLIACSAIGDSTATITTWFVSDSKPRGDGGDTRSGGSGGGSGGATAGGSSQPPAATSPEEIELAATSEEDEEAGLMGGHGKMSEKPYRRTPWWVRAWRSARDFVTLSRVQSRAALVLVGLWLLNRFYT